jgi:ferredoxin/flavodoxin---NADP+ reductase
MKPAQRARLLRASIVERVDPAPGLRVLRLEPEAPLAFAPGQYVSLGLEVGERVLLRPYSIVSAPHEPRLEFFLELVTEGALTPRLFELGEGDEIWMFHRPAGRLLLDRTAATHHLMVATSTGVAPYMSMVRTLVDEAARGREPGVQVFLLHGASYAHDLGPYAGELARIGREWSWLTYVPTVSRPAENPDWTGERGRVEDVLRKYVDGFSPDVRALVGYLCGNPQMIDKARDILLRAGVAPEAVREEKYFLA